MMGEYKEIIKLNKLLEEANIPYTMKQKFDGWQICYPSDENRIISIVEFSGSYGYEKDLLEIMGLLTNKEKQQDCVKGYMTAAKVFERIKNDWEKNVICVQGID